MNPYFATDSPDTIFNIHDLFQYYNTYFFQGILQKCTVKWTNRMTLCAGTCKYEGFGSSTIALSEPILKFRNSNEVKQTLLHEMIHAYLFITDPKSCQSQEGHGPKFKAIMNNINTITGLKLSVYHNFRDQVQLYRKYIWRCNGSCRDKPPFYGYVKRSINRKPQKADHWFLEHQFNCGGQFIQMHQPKKQSKSKSLQTSKLSQKSKLTKVPKKKKLKQINWGKGKTIQDYIKQMNQKNNSKQKSNQNK